MEREQAPRNDVRANSSEATPIFDELLGRVSYMRSQVRIAAIMAPAR